MDTSTITLAESLDLLKNNKSEVIQSNFNEITKSIKKWKTLNLDKVNWNFRLTDVFNEFIHDIKVNEMIEYLPQVKTEFQIKAVEYIDACTPKIEAYEHQIAQKTQISTELDLLETFKTTSVQDLKKQFNLSKVEFKSQISQLDSVQNQNKKLIEAIAKNVETADQLTDLICTLEQENKQLAQQQATLQQKQQLLNQSKSTNLATKSNSNKLDSSNQLTDTELKEFAQKLQDLAQQQEQNQAKIDKASQQLISNNQELEQQKVFYQKEWAKLLEDQEKEIEQNLEKLLQEIRDLKKQFLKDFYNNFEQWKQALQVIDTLVGGDPTMLRNLWNGTSNNGGSITWGDQEGVLSKHYLDKLNEYAQVIEKNPAIIELVRLLGRYDDSKTKDELEEFTEIRQVKSYEIQNSTADDIVGITESKDLNNVLPHEVALLGSSHTENIFYKKYTESKLQTFEHQTKLPISISQSTKGQRTKKSKDEKGPFILAIDTSGSMSGSPETLAKMIAFAITRMALKEKRKVFLITFSIDTVDIELTNIFKSLDKLVDFLTMSFCGGTDITAPVRTAIAKMNTNSYKDSDFLLISDGEFPRLNVQDINDVNKLKQAGNKFNALMISNYYNQKALTYFNHVWEYSPHANNLSDLVNIVEKDLLKS